MTNPSQGHLAIDQGWKGWGAMLAGTFQGTLVSVSAASRLVERLKAFDRRVAYQNRNVLALEARGNQVIQGLMDVFWRAICSREDRKKAGGKRLTAECSYVYALISENYRRIFEHANEDLRRLPIRYRELQLLTDMIAGMTDSFAVTLYENLRERGILRATDGKSSDPEV